MKKLLLRLTLLVPWVFLLWLIGQGMSGDMNMLLIFVLLFILIPGAVVLNLITLVAFQGHQALKVIRGMQKSKDINNLKLESTNYSDLPWWNFKKYKKR